MTVGDSGEISGEIPVYLRLRGLLSASILEHGANPLTVAKAYQSLQDDGYVSVRRGVGMFVADGAIVRLRDDERERFMTQSWPRIRDHMNRIGIELYSLLPQESV
jgi:GntR family transcriptional regulator